jgi:hypothetical protein
MPLIKRSIEMKSIITGISIGAAILCLCFALFRQESVSTEQPGNSALPRVQTQSPAPDFVTEKNSAPASKSAPPESLVVLNAEGHLSTEAADYLGLDDPTRRKMDEALLATAREIQRLDKLHSSVRFDAAKRTIEVDIAPYREEGVRVKNDLLQRAQQILTPDQYARLRALPFAWFEEQYGDFGTNARFFKVSREPLKDGRYGYRVESTRSTEYSDEGATKDAFANMTGTVASREAITRFGNHIPQFVPSDF